MWLGWIEQIISCRYIYAPILHIYAIPSWEWQKQNFIFKDFILRIYVWDKFGGALSFRWIYNVRLHNIWFSEQHLVCCYDKEARYSLRGTNKHKSHIYFVKYEYVAFSDMFFLVLQLRHIFNWLISFEQEMATVSQRLDVLIVVRKQHTPKKHACNWLFNIL